MPGIIDVYDKIDMHGVGVQGAYVTLDKNCMGSEDHFLFGLINILGSRGLSSC